VILSVVHHRQNPLESKRSRCSLDLLQILLSATFLHTEEHSPQEKIAVEDEGYRGTSSQHDETLFEVFTKL
jgi:hypothetical protein